MLNCDFLERFGSVYFVGIRCRTEKQRQYTASVRAYANQRCPNHDDKSSSYWNNFGVKVAATSSGPCAMAIRKGGRRNADDAAASIRPEANRSRWYHEHEKWWRRYRSRNSDLSSLNISLCHWLDYWPDIRRTVPVPCRNQSPSSRITLSSREW